MAAVSCAHPTLQAEVRDLESELQRLADELEFSSDAFCARFSYAALESKDRAAKAKQASLQAQATAVASELEAVKRGAKAEWRAVKQLRAQVEEAQAGLEGAREQVWRQKQPRACRLNCATRSARLFATNMIYQHVDMQWRCLTSF